MTPLPGNPSLYMKEGAQGIHGLLRTYVCDFSLPEEVVFQKKSEVMLKIFESHQRQWDNVEFLGVAIQSIWKKVGREFQKYFKTNMSTE